MVKNVFLFGEEVTGATTVSIFIASGFFCSGIGFGEA